MATRLLHPKARTLILEKIANVKEISRKWNRVLSDDSQWLFVYNEGNKINNLLKDCAEEIIAYEKLLAHPIWEKSRYEPVEIVMSYNTQIAIFGKKLMGTVILFQDSFHLVTGPYSSEEACLIFLKKFKKQRSEVEFLVFRKDTPETEGQYERVRIAEETRNEVWRRDQGCCAKCKSVRNLEFDHIVPVSKGGSNSARNLQLLCETCNRRKSNSIG
jgi:hypothetical protein